MHLAVLKPRPLDRGPSASEYRSRIRILFPCTAFEHAHEHRTVACRVPGRRVVACFEGGVDLTSVAAGPSTDRSIGKYVRSAEKVRNGGTSDDGRTSNWNRSDVRAPRITLCGPEDENEMRRLRTLEVRLRGRLLALALLPTMLVLAAAWVVGARSLEWLGTLGPWTEVAESGRVLIEEAAPAAADNPALAAARERHRVDLSESLTQAQRWSFIGERIIAAAPDRKSVV